MFVAVLDVGNARYRLCSEPGDASVKPTPNWMEVADPGGVNWMTRKPSAGA